MSRAVLSIGSNEGDRLGALQSAVDAFRPWLTGVSAVVQTPPWGPVPQGDYLNAVLLVDGEATPAQWLARAHGAEQDAGRVRTLRWGPRTLDVDIVAVTDGHGEVLSDDPELTLPHPRAAERAFVLVPWLWLDPAATLGGRSVRDLIDGLPVSDVEAIRACPDQLLR